MFWASKDILIFFPVTYFSTEGKAQETVENMDSVIPGAGYRFHLLLALKQNSGLCFLSTRWMSHSMNGRINIDNE